MERALMLAQLSICGRVVIGEGEGDEAPTLYIGEEVGAGTGYPVDIAVDPVEVDLRWPVARHLKARPAQGRFWLRNDEERARVRGMGVDDPDRIFRI